MKQSLKLGVLIAGAAFTVSVFAMPFDPEISVAKALLQKAVACKQELNGEMKDFGPKCQEYARFKDLLVGERLFLKWTEDLADDSRDRPALEAQTYRLLVIDEVVASEKRLHDKNKACLGGAALSGCATVEQLLPKYPLSK